MDGGAGPTPPGGAIATGTERIGQPGADDTPVGGDFGAMAATIISPAFAG